MGEALRVGFEGSLKLEFHGSEVTSDSGPFLDHMESNLGVVLGLTAMAEGLLDDRRKPMPLSGAGRSFTTGERIKERLFESVGELQFES